MTNPELSLPSPAELLTLTINEKFLGIVAVRGRHIREHEESLSLTPTSPLIYCPKAFSVHVTRPIPDEAAQALEKYTLFGGHRVTIHESQGYVQTDFRALGNDIVKRQLVTIPYRLHIQNPDNYTIEDLLEKSKESDSNGRYEGIVLPSEGAEELLSWLSSCRPDQN